ncbi:MAG: hypothetical protein B7Y99_11580 [Caulobacterales bacterium 32-69-10]|nr:MAG: hypothetical protein B7Y99_11580 [Caulobacterales bacterium 32-69-10]
MSMAERILTMDDASLVRLRDNARRLEASPGRQQNEAAALVPLIEAELAERESKKPVKKVSKATLASQAAKAAKAAKLAAAIEANAEAREAAAEAREAAAG